MVSFGRRRALIGAIGAGLAAPRALLAQAQPAKPPSVVVLFAGDAEDDDPALRAFFDEMRRRGWVEGKTVGYERLDGKGSREYVAGLAGRAAESAPDLIVATTSSLALAVAKETRSVPVVFMTSSDPVAVGLVASIARPGGNATGSYQVPGDAIAARYRLLRELLPRMDKVGVIYDRRSAELARQKKANQDAAIAAGLDLEAAEFTNFEAVAKILARFRRARIHVVMMSASFTLLARRREVVALAERNGHVLVAHRVEWPEAGALMSYGPEIAESQRRSAVIADRILRGARPGQIPVERSVEFELVINERVARAHGIAVPQAVMQRADRVID
jgi:putative ABC transport system substrate-binding protein